MPDACEIYENDMPEDTVKLGLMPPLTGLVSIYGTEISRAAQIACQEVNESGGVLGRPLQLVIEDDGSLPDSAVAAAEKLVDQHHCTAIIGNLLSNSRIAVAYRVAEPRKIPFLNFSFYEGSILSRYFFHFAALPNQQIDRMIPYMREKFGPRMYFAGNNYEWPRGSIHAAKLSLERAGGQVVGEEYCAIGIGAAAIEHLLDNIEKAAPDVFVPYFAGADQVNLLTRFTERGLKQRMAVVMGHYDEMMASILPPEVREGFYSSNTYFMSVGTAENQRYLAQLAKLPGVSGIWPKGNGILTNFGEGAYVCVKAFAQAANLAGSLDPEALVDALQSISVAGPQGLVKMNPVHHHAKVNTYLTRCLKDGTFTVVEKFGSIEPVLPERYKHQQVTHRATLEEDIRLQARILEQMTEAVLLVNSHNGSILYTNAGAEKLFGYDKGEMLGLPIATINDPSYKDPLEATDNIISILNKRGEWQGEIRNINKNGTPVWCYTKISIFTHPEHGEVWLAVHRDITERKHMESILLNERERIKIIINELADPVFFKDNDHRIIFANHAFYDMFGMEEIAVIGKTLAEHVPANERQQFLAVDRLVLDTGIPDQREETLTLGDLTRVIVTSKKRFIDNFGERYLVGSIHDITNRKQAERYIQEQARLLDLLFKHSLDNLVLLDKDYNFIRVTESYVRTCNRDISEFAGYNLFELYPSDLKEELVPFRESKQVYSRMARPFIFPDHPEWDTTYWDLSMVPILGADDEIELFVFTLKDVTQKVLADAELVSHREHLEELVHDRTLELTVARNEAESANRSKTLFLTSMSHELRTPLNAIMGYAQLMKLDTSLPEPVIENAREIKHAGDFLLALINDILDLARIESGRLEMKIEAVELGSLLAECLAQNGTLAAGNNIALVCDDSCRSVRVQADHRRLLQVLNNLVSNAIKYNSVAGKVSVSCMALPNGRVRISVQDTGKGIAPDKQSQLFEPFNRLGAEMSQIEGTGIGLAIVRKLVEHMSGTIGMDSVLGKGSTFWVELPDARSAGISDETMRHREG